jgi:hypothetical protein
MKNSNQNGIGSSVRWSISILLIFMVFASLAVTNVAKAEDFNNRPQTHSGAASLDDSPRLVAQLGGTFCYTYYGAFRMYDATPVGFSCTARFNFWPYVAPGTVGF